jgi:hypothetical protein
LDAFLKVSAILGPFVGILIGSWLTMNVQRKLWTLDNKRAEYRMLLTTLTDAGSKLIVFYGAVPNVVSAKQNVAIGETARKSANLIYNRLFIADVIVKLNIPSRWQDGISALRQSHDGIAFAKVLDAIMTDLRSAAIKDFS